MIKFMTNNSLIALIRTTTLLWVMLLVPVHALGGMLIGSGFEDRMYSIDPTTGQATFIGNNLVNGNGKGLAYDAKNDVLFGISTSLTDLYTVDITSGAWTEVGGNFSSPTFPALTYNINDETLYGAEHGPQELFSIDPLTGQRTSIGSTSQRISGLAYDAISDTLYGAGGDNNLYDIDMGTGALTMIGALGVNAFNVGLAYDYDTGTLYLNSQSTRSLYSVNTDTGLANLLGANLTGSDSINGLTYIGTPVPAPGTLMLMLSGLFASMLLRMRRS